MAIVPPPKTAKGNPRPVVRIDEEKQMAVGGVLHTHVAPGQLTGILVALKVMFSWREKERKRERTGILVALKVMFSWREKERKRERTGILVALKVMFSWREKERKRERTGILVALKVMFSWGLYRALF